MSPNANEQDGTNMVKSTNIPLPIHVLRHCLSFLGPSDNYYFLASVSKDFKTVVEQLYGENRNTSAGSIIATVSTCNHVVDLIHGDTELKKEEKGACFEKIAMTIFDNDRVDIFEGSIMHFRIGTRKMHIVSAIANKSTEIMRLIIKNQKSVQFMKHQITRNGVSLASYAPAACDVCMIKELMDHGVAFNKGSLLYALKRDDLDTFEYLVDQVKVRVYDRKEKAGIVCEALVHQKCNDAFQMLMRNGFVCLTDLGKVLLRVIAYHSPTLDLIKLLLGLLANEIEIHNIDEFFHVLVSICVKQRRMDILSYINTCIREIDVEYYIFLYLLKDDEKSVEFLRGML